MIARLNDNMAGAVFEHILLAEHTEVELAQHEEALARPSRVALRVWQLKRHKCALDALMRELPSTVDLMVVHEGDEQEAQELVVYCQDKWRGLTSGLGGLRSHRRNKSAAAMPSKRRKTKDVTVSSSQSKDEDEEEQSEHQEEQNQAQADERRVEQEKRVEEEEEQQSVLVEGDEAAGPEWLPQLRLDLDAARESTATVLYVLSMRDVQGIINVNIDGVEPSADSATAMAGKSLVDDGVLGDLLRSDDDDNGVGVEDLARLSHWWRIVGRAYKFHGLFQYLRGGARKRGHPRKSVPLEEKWQTLVRDVRGNTYCFTTAAHYDRIGAFLVQYPGFLWQTQFATLAQWKRTFDDGSGGRAKNLVAVLGERMSDEDKLYWSSFDRIRDATMRLTGELDGVDV